MKLFCCYTPAHEQLFHHYFEPSIPPPFETEPLLLNITGEGNFLGQDFLHCIREKISLIQKSISDNLGSVIVWSDVDIVFVENVKLVIDDIFGRDASLELLFQREGKRLPDVNTGFVAIRCDQKTLFFFEEVARRLSLEPAKNEQAVVNDMLGGSWDIRWDYLPWSFYARTHGWPPPRDTVLYHANYTKGANGVEQKIQQLEEFSRIRGNEFARLWSCIRRIPAKLRRTRV